MALNTINIDFPNTASGTYTTVTTTTAAPANGYWVYPGKFYSSTWTNWTPSPGDTVPIEEPDTFADWVTEVRRIAALEESIQGS